MKDEMTIKEHKSKVYDQTCDKTDRSTYGLYNPAYEHDACGVGMIVNLNGSKSHELVDSALRVLENMKHRGAEGADNKTGDGAGIMVQIPHEFILLQGIPVPEKGKYGTGLIFLPKDPKEQEHILSIVIEEIEREGLTLMHLRAVPVNTDVLGQRRNRTSNKYLSPEPHNPKIWNVRSTSSARRLNSAYTIRISTSFPCPAAPLYIRVCFLPLR